MSLVDKINAGIKQAMKDKAKQKLTALRAVKAAILLAQTESKDRSLTEAEEVKLLQKLVKQRKESFEIYNKQGRADLADVEKVEMDCISEFLPEAMSPEEVEANVKQVIEELGASSMKDMGRVMGVASKKLAGQADGSQISTIVKQLLS